MLAELDWHRFQQLVAGLLHQAGYRPEVAWIRPDGGTGLTVVHPSRAGGLYAVVQCAPWTRQEVDAAALQSLHELVQAEGATRGIYVTPGTIQPEARAFAQEKPLELVDGSDLLGILQRLPTEERAHYLRMATVGSYQAPTCPSCMGRMSLLDESTAAAGRRRRDLVYKDRKCEGSEVDCRSLTLKRNAEITFLKSVTTGNMTVHGKATGNIVVNGRLHVAQGGCVSGLVSARSIQLDAGGNLEAEARILNEAELAHLRPVPVHQFWRCANHPKCPATLPVR